MKLLDIKALNAAIKSIAVRARKLDQDIQIAAVSSLAHIQEHGDVRPLNDLRNALGQGHRRNALDAWALAFGKVVANGDPKTKKTSAYLYDREGTTNLEGAIAEPWFTFKPDQDADQVFNVQKAVRAILTKAAKKNVEDAAFLQSLTAFLDTATVADPLAAVTGEEA